jgi:hypothetical protein
VFPEIGEMLKASFSKNAQAEIEYIVIVIYIEEVGCHWHNSKRMLKMPVRGYMLHQNE